MRDATIHVVGAGLSGLSAATALAEKGVRVVLHEAAPQAGGRCRSYADPVLGRTIDNGNHLVLSGNHAVMAYLRRIGAEKNLAGPARARFEFADVIGGGRWTVAPNEGPLPWWIASARRRVPGTRAADYLGLLGLLWPGRRKRICDVIACRGPLWDRLLRPFLLAALNTEPETASASLAASVIRETLARGGRAYRPRIAHPTLAAAFVEPALAYLAERGASVFFGRRLRRIVFSAGAATALEFPEATVPLSPEDAILLCVPPWAARELLPGISAPDDFRAIVNAHFAIVPPRDAPAMLGVIGGTAEWIFAFPDRISTTISGADRLVDMDRDRLIALVWGDVTAALRLSEPLPPWQIVKERRATFAATVEQSARRAETVTKWANLFLAGDWTDTGLPATIEGAVRSGHRAAGVALRRMNV
ncbi:MAG TPA: hydroxysqualene dehydroxylase HpnE [Rhizomicrobium sp.]|jgi:squalene-associated FAD-dependent desaturase|nr:hydroxysqualene dehydroxylase HpnE [Rhizomicrobium sp.]